MVHDVAVICDMFICGDLGQVPEANTGMPDEQNYESHLMSIHDAIRILQQTRSSVLEHLVREAWCLWAETVVRLAQEAQGATERHLDAGEGSDATQRPFASDEAGDFADVPETS